MIPVAMMDGTEVALAAIALAATAIGAVVVLVKVAARRTQDRETRTREISARLTAVPAPTTIPDTVARILGRLEGQVEGMHREVLAEVRGVDRRVVDLARRVDDELGMQRRRMHEVANDAAKGLARVDALERRIEDRGAPGPERRRPPRPEPGGPTT